MAKTKDDETRDLATVNQIIPDYDPSESWESLTGEADQVLGADIAKGELLRGLIGVPFVAVRVQYRPGLGAGGCYVTMTAVIAPESMLRKRRVNLDEFPFEPGGQIIVNTGSTGIKRQLTAYLAGRGFIRLPDGPTEGASGESVWDLPPAGWEEIIHGETGFTDESFQTYDANIRLVCPRGLRVSENYDPRYPDAETFYLG